MGNRSVTSGGRVHFHSRAERHSNCPGCISFARALRDRFGVAHCLADSQPNAPAEPDADSFRAGVCESVLYAADRTWLVGCALLG